MANELQTGGEYHQMTITEWIEIKNEIARELRNVSESFVRIGFQLRRVRDEKLYEQDGYTSLGEFAEKEYGLSPSTTSRFIAINERYSVDGNSKLLKPEYYEYGQTKLAEMLQLPDKDLQMITPDMQRDDIRELKSFNRSGPQEGVADDKYQLFDGFYKDNQEIVKALYGSGTACCGTDEMKETIIPGGNRVYRKGLYFVSFTETDVKVKKFGGEPESLSWSELRDLTEAIFAGDAGDGKTYEKHYGILEEEDGRESIPESPAGAGMGLEGETEGTAGITGEGQTAGAADEAEGADRGVETGGEAAGTDGERESGGASESSDEGEEGGAEEESDGQEGSAPASDSGDEQSPEEEGTEELAPAQIEQEEQESKPEETAQKPEQNVQKPEESVQKPQKNDRIESKEPENDFMNAPEDTEEEPEPVDEDTAIRIIERQLREEDYKISMKMKKIRDEVERKAYATARVAAVSLAELLKEANQVYSELLAERGKND